MEDFKKQNLIKEILEKKIDLNFFKKEFIFNNSFKLFINEKKRLEIIKTHNLNIYSKFLKK